MAEQIGFEPSPNEFADNPEPRIPCVLLLDISGSMQGDPIRQLNEGLVVYKDECSADALAAKRVEAAVVTFGGNVETQVDFCTIGNFSPPHLQAGGDTPMGAAILQAIDMVKKRKETYKSAGISYYRPWIFMITDGGPTDAWKSAAAEVRKGEDAKAFCFFGVGVEGANFEILNQICTREPLKLKGLEFRKLFLWLTASQKAVSMSNPGENVALPSPTGWATTG
ncbi:MAG TPA: VWA domain-containing protein [Gemmatales bacterium]|nr:VWA domain-containing protein [Gemmatales bacterium]